MARLQGQFVWYELVTDDLDAAAAFYAAVTGWSAVPFDDGETDYRIFNDAQGSAGGMMPRPAKMRDAGGPPQWLGYVGCEDVDAAAQAIADAGGSLWMPPQQIGDIGRIALVADPWGAPLYLMRPSRPDDGNRVFDQHAIGRCGWNELATADQAGAFALFGAVFGWRKDGAMPMGEMGDYSFLSDGERQIGAVMGPIPDQRPRWRFYFRVADMAAAADRVAAGGGTIIHGPAPVPTGDHILIGRDPQGAEFALVGAAGG